MKETSCDLTDMISLLFFLCSEFKFENIYSGVNFNGKMFAVIFICGNLYLWIARKTSKIRTQKFCATWYGTKEDKNN